jgi:hypothetical protein
MAALGAAAVALPAPTFDDVLTLCGATANVVAVLIDPDREALTLEALAAFDDDQIEDLCISIRKQSLAATPLYVSGQFMDKFKTLAYISRHFARAQRTVDPAIIDAAFIQRWTGFRKAEKEYKDPDDEIKLTKADDATIDEFIDEFPEKIATLTGTGGRPLAYVIRDDVGVMDQRRDVLIGERNTRYGSVRQEIISRAEINPTCSSFISDNERVYQILSNALVAHKHVHVWIKGYAKRKDGRAAWRAFVEKYRGAAQLRVIANRADTVLNTNKYTGEKRMYSFDKHVALHKRAHLDLATAGTEPSERDKVRRLVDSIEASYLTPAKMAILADSKMVEDFEAAINYLKQFVPNYSSSQRTVAALGSMSNILTDSEGNTAEVRWYKPEEWKELSSELQSMIRDRRPKPPGGDKPKVKPKGKGTEAKAKKNKARNERRRLARVKAREAKGGNEKEE